ncbi:MAG: hypothetical protein JSS49_05865 [Planctomycetes bacterium]|nr:hypothetical protein [Planctomycetota bacterium]
MSLLATCWWTLVRTVVLCLVAWPICQWIERTFHVLTPARRTWLLVGLLAPFCFPELIVGYVFRDLALSHPAWAEALCAGLLLVRLIPVGTIALMVAPPAELDATAIHTRRMLLRSGQTGQWFELVRCYWFGPIVRALPALALMSTVAFQEFEMAALLQTMGWTDWFVTAQRLGLEQSEMFQQSLWPLAWQMPVIIAVVFWLFRRRSPLVPGPGNLAAAHSQRDRLAVRVGVSCVLVAVLIGCVIPLGLMGWRTVDGFRLLLRQRPQQIGLAREMGTSAAVAVTAAIGAWNISGRLRGVAAIGLLPGLLGSMLLSLGCVALFQTAWLRPLYDTPLPWVVSLTVWLLPRAAILRLWLNARQDSEAIHAVKLLAMGAPGGMGIRYQRQTSAILWHLRERSQFLAVSLLCYWAYCDLPTAYMLAPSGMASGLVRLYNFMHFGRSAALSAEALLFFGIPIACLSLLLLVKRRVSGPARFLVTTNGKLSG